MKAQMADSVSIILQRPIYEALETLLQPYSLLSEPMRGAVVFAILNFTADILVCNFGAEGAKEYLQALITTLPARQANIESVGRA